MNLYFRLIIILIKSGFTGKIGILDESRTWFRVWPFDCDVNFHLTNARYFSLCDLSRIYYMAQVGVLFKLIKRQWMPVVQAQEISYMKPINPFQRFQIRTRFWHWDDRYWYTEHKFYIGEQLCALLQVRGVFVHDRKTVSMPDIMALVDEQVEVPDKPVNVECWQSLLEAKKNGLRSFRATTNRDQKN